MPKKVIQVPIDQALLTSLDRVSKIQQRARAEVIREACLGYLRRFSDEEKDIKYRKGYARLPEKEGVGRAQARVSGDCLTKEGW